MIEIAKGTLPSMALQLAVNPGQRNQAPLTPDSLFKLAASGPTWNVRLNGRIVAVGGYTELWPGRAALWAYLGGDCGPALPAMTRAVRQQVAAMQVEFPRIEVYAERNHKAGRRWLEILGFRKEGVMRRFAHNADYIMYSKVT